MKLEEILRECIGKRVELNFETRDGSSHIILGTLLEVTDDYIKVFNIDETNEIYINRKAVILIAFRVYPK